MIFLYYWQHLCLLQKMNYGGVNMVVQIPLRANQDPGRCSRGLLGCVGVCAGKKRRFIATSHETPRSPRAVKEIDHIANRYFLLNFNQVFRLKYFPHCSWAQKNDIRREPIEEEGVWKDQVRDREAYFEKILLQAFYYSKGLFGNMKLTWKTF